MSGCADNLRSVVQSSPATISPNDLDRQKDIIFYACSRLIATVFLLSKPPSAAGPEWHSAGHRFDPDQLHQIQPLQFPHSAMSARRCCRTHYDAVLAPKSVLQGYRAVSKVRPASVRVSRTPLRRSLRGWRERRENQGCCEPNRGSQVEPGTHLQLADCRFKYV